MAASGSLTRSVLNANSGAKTPMSSFYAGLICIGGAFLFGPFIAYVPIPALSVLVIFIGISLINGKQIQIVTKSTQSDAIVFYLTIATGMLFSLTTAIYVGVLISITLFLRKVSTPELVEYQFDQDGGLLELKNKDKRTEPEISIVHVEGELFFAAAELFNEQIRRVCEDDNLKVLVLKMRNAYNLDATSVMAFQELIQYMNEKDRTIIVSEIREDTMRIFKNSGLIKTLNPLNVFKEEGTNPTLSTAKALRRAKEILGSSDVKVTIFADETKKS
jgi:SulP family sulfate permease